MDMAVETLLKLVSSETLEAILNDAEEACGAKSITATEVRFKVRAERRRREAEAAA